MNVSLHMTAGILGLALIPHTASAVSLEVVKACDALVAKSFPPRQIGNPAAGSDAGSAKEQRAYFQKCVANGGKVDDGQGKPDDATKPK